MRKLIVTGRILTMNQIVQNVQNLLAQDVIATNRKTLHANGMEMDVTTGHAILNCVSKPLNFLSNLVFFKT